MVQSLLRGDTLSRIIDEDLLEQIKKVLEERIVGGGDGILVIG